MLLNESTLFDLLECSIFFLKKLSDEELSLNQGSKFELILLDSLEKAIKKLNIINVKNVELVSGQKFPDIVINTKNEKLGIEVKTSRTKGWDTLGGSIFESTRVHGVNDIVVFFASFYEKSPKYKYNWMDKCIVDIAITHKPRYVLNMDIKDDQTIFSKTNTSYKQLSNAKNPFSLVRDYMKEKSGDLWWFDNENSDNYNYQNEIQGVKIWTNLNKTEQDKNIIKIIALFPIIFAENKHYNEIATYLVTKRGIVNPSLRDIFSAGGAFKTDYQNYPKYFKRLFSNEFIKLLSKELSNIDINLVKDYWNIDIAQADFKEKWKEKTIYYINDHNTLKLCQKAKSTLINRINIL